MSPVSSSESLLLLFLLGSVYVIDFTSTGFVLVVLWFVLLLLYAYTLISCVMQSLTGSSSWDLGLEKVRLWSNRDSTTCLVANRLQKNKKKNLNKQ